jgi:hypothetical protein
MTVPNQVFLLFYAVLYGALFTITDKWRPLMGSFGCKGLRRLGASVVCYGLAPVSYFVVAFMQLEHLRKPTCVSLSIPLSILCVAPLIFFHFCWIWWVVPRRERYYEVYHLKTDETLRAAIRWTVADRNYKCCRAKVVSFVVLLLLPLAALFFVLPRYSRPATRERRGGLGAGDQLREAPGHPTRHCRLQIVDCRLRTASPQPTRCRRQRAIPF